MKLEIAIVMGCLLLNAVGCGDDDSSSAATPVYVGPAAVAANDDTAAAYAATDALADPFFLAQRVGTGTDSNPTVSDTEAAATAAADAVDHYFTPKDCGSATAAGNQVTYKLKSCGGPFGVRDASGTINVTFSAPSSTIDAGGEGEQSLAFNINSSGLTLDSEDATLAIDGTYTRDTAGQKMIAMTSKSNFTRDGRQLTENVSRNINWQAGTQCIDLNSSGKFTTNGQTLSVKINDYSRCGNECPQSGTVQTTGDNTTTLTLDGTGHPNYKVSDGRTGAVSLDCEVAPRGN